MSRITRPPLADAFDYPTSDGRPMAETDWHRDVMINLIETLDRHFKADPAVYVSGDLLLYYERGNRRRRVAPDVFVVRGVEKKLRRHYLMWDEGRPPECVIEVTSATTRRKDRDKVRLYRDVLGVPEVFLCDPTSDYLCPQLQRYCLENGHYKPIAPVNSRLPSRGLELHLEQYHDWVRFFDPVAGGHVRSHQEDLARYRESLQEIERLHRENARLRCEIEKLRRQSRKR